MSALALFDRLWKDARPHLHLQIETAARRALEHVNRSAGQHRRHMKKEYGK